MAALKNGGVIKCVRQGINPWQPHTRLGKHWVMTTSEIVTKAGGDIYVALKMPYLRTAAGWALLSAAQSVVQACAAAPNSN
ncbi:putative chitin- type 1 [Rosellinia necatrix]|uniref:Putative chitin-type 1 n=1 Tax=Rosellinia necatrix TaxID=77044 RepID=A0A1S8AB08_ROSNE|nr:putative chitin- type 1 [Rosellinia necatrix]